MEEDVAWRQQTATVEEIQETFFRQRGEDEYFAGGQKGQAIV